MIPFHYLSVAADPAAREIHIRSSDAFGPPRQMTVTAIDVRSAAESMRKFSFFALRLLRSSLSFCFIMFFVLFVLFFLALFATLSRPFPAVFHLSFAAIEKFCAAAKP